MKGCDYMNLNGGYAMIKHNSTQEELAVAYKSKRPALFYDENQRAHWAVIEEKATESVDEETQEPITLYEYSYRLIDEANEVVANPTLSGNEATLNGLEIDGTKYKVGGGGSEVHLYQHNIIVSNNGKVTIYNNSDGPFTSGSLATYASNNGPLQVVGKYKDSSGYDGYYYSYSASSISRTIISFLYNTSDNTFYADSKNAILAVNNDIVTQIL